jgi:alpha-amylase/alpha-mannosidase (GH57 family)
MIRDQIFSYGGWIVLLEQAFFMPGETIILLKKITKNIEVKHFVQTLTCFVASHKENILVIYMIVSLK